MAMLKLVLVGCLATGIAAQCLTGNDNPPTMNSDTHTMLKSAKLDFALEALRQASVLESEDNLFFSPHSLFEALMLAYFGARGTTEQSLKQALRMPEALSKIDVQRSYSFGKWLRQQRQFTSDASISYELNTANRLWIDSSKKIRDCMLTLFPDELQLIDFRSNSEAARSLINEWVSNTTKGQIVNLLPASSIDESTDLVLANAVYFKGLWKNKFDPKNSKRDIFYDANKSIVTFMRQKGTFNHLVSEDLGVHVLELPYKNGNISMVIFLPPTVSELKDDNGVTTPTSAKVDEIRQLLHRMISTPAGLQELKSILDDGMAPREVEVSIPRFTLERELPVSQLIRSMGAGEIFDAGADLRGFTEDNLHLGDAVHRARIALSEEGTTAAAATAIFSFRSSRPAQPAFFIANHPFVYLIYDKENQNILFFGVFRSAAGLAQNS